MLEVVIVVHILMLVIGLILNVISGGQALADVELIFKNKNFKTIHNNNIQTINEYNFRLPIKIIVAPIIYTFNIVLVYLTLWLSLYILVVVARMFKILVFKERIKK